MQNTIKALAYAAVFAVAPVIARAQGTKAPTEMGQDVGHRLSVCMNSAVHIGLQSGAWRTVDDAVQGVLSSCGANITESLVDCQQLSSNGDKYGNCRQLIYQLGAAIRFRMGVEGYGPDFDHRTSNGQIPLVKMPPRSPSPSDPAL
jgi:hypothetical protein